MTLRFEIGRTNRKRLTCEKLRHTLKDHNWNPHTREWSDNQYEVFYDIVQFGGELHLNFNHAECNSRGFLAMIIDTVLVLDHVEYRFSRIEYEAEHGYYEDLSTTVSFIFAC